MPENDKETASAPTRPPPRKKGGGAKIIFVLLIVLALVGVIVYLLSLLNSKTFFLEPEGGELVVKKGIFFPVGSEIYRPKDPDQAALYKPIDLPEELQHAGPIRFEDLPSLNRELAKYLIKHANNMVFSDNDKQYAKGKAYLERVRKLHGLDPEQVDRIKSLRADVDYIEAKRAYLGVEKILERARRKFRQAETFGTGRFADASEWIRKIETLLQAIKATKAGVRAEDAEIEGPAEKIPPPPVEEKEPAAEDEDTQPLKPRKIIKSPRSTAPREGI